MIVVDTSVVVKWFVPEEGTSDALSLISCAMVAPDLLQSEFGHVLTKKVRRDELTVDQARRAFDDAPALLSLIPSPPHARLAFDLSLELRHSMNDCYFLALAATEGLMLITADAKFADKVAATRYAPLIVCLGDPYQWPVK